MPPDLVLIWINAGSFYLNGGIGKGTETQGQALETWYPHPNVIRDAGSTAAFADAFDTHFNLNI